MKVKSPLVVLVCILVAVVFFPALYLYFGFRSWQTMRAFGHLEQNARRVVTTSALQSWATNLLAQHPEGIYLNGTNARAACLKQLTGLCPDTGPTISSNPTEDTNAPPVLYVQWSSGFLGATGFEIGPTNYLSSNPKAHAWGPGVYFYKR